MPLKRLFREMTAVANALKHPCLKAIRDLPSTEASLNLSVLIWQVCLFYLYFNNKTHFIFKGKVYYLIRVFKTKGHCASPGLARRTP